MPAGGAYSFFLRLLRLDNHRRRLIARARRHGARVLQLLHTEGRRLGVHSFAGRRRRRGPRHGLRVHHGGRRGHHNAGPAAPLVIPEAQPLPAWILAGQATPNLHADEVLEPEGEDMVVDDPDLAAPPPPQPCPVHGWACPRLAASAAPWPPRSQDLPSPTPAHEQVNAGATPSSAGLGLRLPAPAAVHGDVFDNGASSSTAPAPPPNRRIRFIVSRAALEASRARRQQEEWRPMGLGLSNGHSNGVAPGTQLPGGTSSEEEEDGAPGPSAPRR